MHDIPAPWRRARRARRHLPTLCLVSIVIAFQPVPSMRLQLPDVVAHPMDRLAVPMMVQVTAQLCVSGDRCGVLTARVSAMADAR